MKALQSPVWVAAVGRIRPKQAPILALAAAMVQAKAIKPFQGVPSSLGSGAGKALE